MSQTTCFICNPDNPKSRDLICGDCAKKGIVHLKNEILAGRIPTPGPTCWIYDYDDEGNGPCTRVV